METIFKESARIFLGMFYYFYQAGDVSAVYLYNL